MVISHTFHIHFTWHPPVVLDFHSVAHWILWTVKAFLFLGLLSRAADSVSHGNFDTIGSKVHQIVGHNIGTIGNKETKLPVATPYRWTLKVILIGKGWWGVEVTYLMTDEVSMTDCFNFLNQCFFSPIPSPIVFIKHSECSRYQDTTCI